MDLIVPPRVVQKFISTQMQGQEPSRS
jgi:hypothetical protein